MKGQSQFSLVTSHPKGCPCPSRGLSTHEYTGNTEWTLRVDKPKEEHMDLGMGSNGVKTEEEVEGRERGRPDQNTYARMKILLQERI